MYVIMHAMRYVYLNEVCISHKHTRRSPSTPSFALDPFRTRLGRQADMLWSGVSSAWAVTCRASGGRLHV